MKKLILVPLLLLTLVLFGCSSESRITEKLASRLEIPFEYSVKSDNYSFTYKKEKDKTTMIISEPEPLSGLTLVRDENGVNASYDGLVVTLPSRAAKRIFILDDIVDSVLVSLSDGNYVCESRDGKEVISTTSGSYAYSIEMNGKTGDIISAAAESGTEKYEYLFLQ